MRDERIDLWALDEVHFQQQGSRCRMWVAPEDKDPVVFHHPTRKSVGYFGAVRLNDGRFFFRRETVVFNGETFWEFLRPFSTPALVPVVASSPSATTPAITAPDYTAYGESSRCRRSVWTSCRRTVQNSTRSSEFGN